MALKDYREEFFQVFTDFENINISFDEITKKIPASRIDGDENQASERFFRSMNASVKEIKETIQNLRTLMATDSKEEEAMNKFEILMDQVKFIRAEQNDFRTFLKKSEFEDLEIPGMRDIYKIFTAAHKFMGVYTQMDALKYVDEVEGANKAYDDSLHKYKEHKKEFVEKYNGQDVKSIAEDVKTLTEEYDKKVEEKDKYTKILANLTKQRGDTLKRLGTWFDEEVQTIDQDIEDWSIPFREHEKSNEAIQFYLDEFRLNITPILEPVPELKKEAERLTRKVNEASIEKGTMLESFTRSETKLKEAYAQNSNLKPYIVDRMEQIDYQMIGMCLELYKQLDENTKLERLPAVIQDMIKERLDLPVTTNPPLSWVYDEVQKKLESLNPTAASVDNPSLEAALSEYESRGKLMLTIEYQGHVKATELKRIETKINKLEKDHKGSIKILQSELKEKGIIKDDWSIERLQKAKPEEVEQMLKDSKEANDESIAAYKEKIAALEEERTKKEKLLIKINSQSETANKTRENLEKEVGELKGKLDAKKAMAKELNLLYKEYNDKEAARAEAVQKYEQNKDKFKQYELSTMQTAASDFYDRVDDAAKGHKNSTEFQTMSDILKDVRDMGSATREQRAAKLTELKAAIETYQKAKEAQNRWRWIPTNLRKTRLAFADELAKWTDENLKKLEKGSAKHLKQLEETYSKLSEKQKEKSKPKEMDAFADSMEHKVKQAAAPVKEDANEKVNEEDMELGAK